ncbi:MAG TPA: hypothetical protein VFB58_14320 [Chloroflexota bacterium]|nr:hypothetical protein [Chloroflexota bacterium]
MAESTQFHSDAAEQAFAPVPRSLDDRLTLLSVRMFYIAGSFFFASFYFGLVYLQIMNLNNMWLPHGIDHPPAWIGVSEVVLVLLAGSAYFVGQWFGMYRGNFSLLRLMLWVASLLTVVAVIIHIYELHNPGFSLQGGGYVSLFIAIETVFTIFLVVTALVLIGVAIRAQKGLFSRNGIAVAGFGEYFGWLAGVALFNFLALYVQPFFPIA